jgi:DNA-binding NtrC family response regulator/tetratricopeptide (TPR) repeat protein
MGETPNPLAQPVAFVREGLALAPSSSLKEIDELARDAEARGFVFVQAAPAVLDAVIRHVERRARALGRPLVKVDGLPADDPWRELGARFLPVMPVDVIAGAQAILDRAGPAILLVRDSAPTRFGRSLSAELAARSADGSTRALILALTEASPTNATGRLVEVGGEISGDDLQIWWEAIAGDPGPRPGAGAERLDALEAWWAAARATPLSQRVAPPALGPDATRLLGRVVLSQRSWLVAQIGRLGLDGGPSEAHPNPSDLHGGPSRSRSDVVAAAQELVRAGALALDMGGRLVAGGSLLPDLEPDVADHLAVAAALETLADPWAAARAGELYAAAGAVDRAEAASVRAVSALVDPGARADFWRRWERTLAALPDAEALPRLLRGVDLALRAGDVERALDLGNTALSKRPVTLSHSAQPDTFAIWLALGRVNVARGDLSTASYWLGLALDGADGSGVPAASAMVDVELAEVCHMEGDMAGARRHADLATAAPGVSAATRLHARNVLGKVLLAQSAWARAEAHFAADACEAALTGDLSARLRARLNRAIALFSGGRLDDAQAMLGAVLDEGEAQGELRAVAYALSNLAAIATLKHEYMEALRLNERAFEARRRLGDKVALAVLITNLADLKLQLGLVDEAEQTLAFGRQACGPAMPRARISHFAITAALVHLERGRTDRASAELQTALDHARGSTHGARFGECWRVAARIALEDGDHQAAEDAIARAREVAESPREHAWVAVLEATRARAAGEPFADAAADALARARAADDPELGRDAHVLLHHAAVLHGDRRSARTHLDAAAALRDHVAGALPDDVRRRFLARRDLAELTRLLSATQTLGQAGGHPQAPGLPPPAAEATPRALPEPSRPRAASVPPPSFPAFGQPQSALPALRRMVGHTPAMRALASAILKVGQSDATVLVHGESGTGKELVASAIHEASPRRAGPIVKVNCAALVETLLLSELFGHEKGSFTGAAARRRGRFELAEGGTLFLDEIGDISPRTQVALLRVLQDKTFERVGGVLPIRANVRIVCATHRDLGNMVARGEFREDLYYRLRGVVLDVPALRQRVADLPLIAEAILDLIAAERDTPVKRLSPAALEGLARHRWPGNVRELENALRAAALFAESDVIELSDITTNVASLRDLSLPDCPAAPDSSAPASGPVTLASPELQDSGTDAALEMAAMSQPSKFSQLGSSEAPGSTTDVAYAAIRAGVSLSDLKRDIERDCIARALAETGGNITRAASLLGMKRPRLSQLVKQYGFGSPHGVGSDGDSDAEDEG